MSAVMSGILEVTRDRPWLWAVFLVVVVLPIVLIIAYCCMSKDKVRPAGTSRAPSLSLEGCPARMLRCCGVE